MKKQLARRALAAATMAAMCASADMAIAADFRVFYADQPGMGRSVQSDREIRQSRGVTQIDLGNGNLASVVGEARFTLNEDGSLRIDEGSATIRTGETTSVVVRLPNGVQGTVPAGGNSARFSAEIEGAEMNVMTGRASLLSANKTLELGVGGFASANGSNAPKRILAGQPQAVPEVINPAALSALDLSSVVQDANYFAHYSAGTAFGAQQMTEMWALALAALYEYVKSGNSPSEYGGGLTREQVLVLLQGLESSGELNTFLGAEQAAFWQAYHAFLANGGLLDEFPGLADNTPVDVTPPPPPPPTGGGDTPVPPAPPPVSGSRLLQRTALMTAANRPGDINGGVILNSAGPIVVKVRNLDDTPTGMHNMVSAGDLVIPEEAAKREFWSDGKGNAIGRLSTKDGGFEKFRVNGKDLAFTARQGLHFLYLAPGYSAPASGEFKYKLAYATQPTWDSGDLMPGKFVADMVVAFQGTVQRLGMTGTIEMPGDATYGFTTAGGLAGTATLAEPLMNPNKLVLALTGSGRACPQVSSGCQLNLSYAIAGPDASNVGIVYNSTGFNASEHFSGAAMFIQDGAYTPPPPTPPASNVHPFAGKTLAPANTIAYTDLKATVGGVRGLGMSDRFTFDAKGAIIQQGVDNNVGTAKITDVGALDKVLAWTRWTNPGMMKGGTVLTGDDKATQSWMAVAVPYSAPSEAIARYVLVGGVAPRTRLDEVPGTMYGTAAISFGGTPKIGFDFAVKTAQGAEYKIYTMGSMPTPNIPIQYNGQFQMSDNWADNKTMCGSSKCYVNLYGFVGGTGATHVGAAYTISVPGSNGDASVNGIAAFVKEGLPQTVIGPAALTDVAVASRSVPTVASLPPAQTDTNDWSRWADGVAATEILGEVDLAATAVSGEAAAESGESVARRVERLFGGSISFQRSLP